MTPAYPNPVWLQHGYLYLGAIIDGYSRYVVAWDLSETLELQFVPTAAKRALPVAVPTIGNHDQGSHFTGPQYTAVLLVTAMK